MAPFRFFSFSTVLVLSLFATFHDAFAITAKDVMDKMEEKERFAYVTGLVDMLSYEALLSGNQTRAQCIVGAFYGQKDQTWPLVFQTFGKYPDKAPEGLVVVLMNHACGS